MDGIISYMLLIIPRQYLGVTDAKTKHFIYETVTEHLSIFKLCRNEDNV